MPIPITEHQCSKTVRDPMLTIGSRTVSPKPNWTMGSYGDPWDPMAKAWDPTKFSHAFSWDPMVFGVGSHGAVPTQKSRAVQRKLHATM
jgi:hypothetical protein